DTTRKVFSAVGPSMMSQPVSIASEPRLKAPRRNSRRDGCGNSFAASLIRSLASTPGGALRFWGIGFPLSPKYNGAQAVWHEQRKDDMDGKKSQDCRNGEEVDITCGVIAAEQHGQIFELHRFPDRQPGQNDDDAGHEHAGIEQALYRIVDGEVVMGEPPAQ